MTVFWSELALSDREALLETAFHRARASHDPQIYQVALEQDERIEAEGNALDGVATYRQGPLPDSRLYTTRDGRMVLLYRRDGDDVEIERVRPARSNWSPTP